MSYPQFDPTPSVVPAQPLQLPAQGPSRLLPILGTALGLLGLIAGVVAWLRPTDANSAASSLYSDQQVADAKKAVCEAYEKGVRSMRVVAARVVDDPADTLPVAVNSRLAEVGVGNYFVNALAMNPAAPPGLQDDLRRLAQAYQDIALIQLAGGAPVDYKTEKEIANAAVEKLDLICQ